MFVEPQSPNAKLPRSAAFDLPEITAVAIAFLILIVAYSIRVGDSDFRGFWNPTVALLLAIAYGLRERGALLTFVSVLFVRLFELHESTWSLPILFESAVLTGLYAAATALLRRLLGKDGTVIRTRGLWIYGIVAIALSACVTAIELARPFSGFAVSGSLSARQALEVCFAYLNGLFSVGAFFIFFIFPELKQRQQSKGTPRRSVPKMPRRLRLQAFAGFLAQWAVLLIGLWFLFSSRMGDKLQLFYFLFLPIVWIAVRRGVRETLLALLLLNACLAMLFPFRQEAQPLLQLQLFMLLLSVTGLFLGNFADKMAAARDELAERTTYLHALVENSPLAILVHRNDGTINLSNPAFQRMFGYSPREIYGHNVDEFVRAPEGSGEEVELTKSILNGEPIHLKTSRLHKDGHVFAVELHGVPLFVNDRIAGGIGIYKDISEQTRLEDELLMDQKLKAVGQLAGGVAHDFNNILGIVQGYSESLLSQMAKESEYRDSMEEILQAAKRGTGLTRQLLAFGRKQMIQPIVMELNSCVANTAKMLGRLIGEDIELAILPDLGNGKIKADPNQIEQVLMNLVVNARDAMPRGGKLTIETGNIYLHEQYAASYAPVPPGRYVMLAVCDTGVGMSPEVRAKIFDPFFTTKEKGKGTGLGLATVYGIVQQAGGHIRVDSELGHGSAFRVFFPRVDDQVAEPVDDPSADANILRGTETILLLEDEVSFRKMTAEFLRRAGYTVLVAETASDATQFVQMHPTSIHLLLTDVVMPDINGPQLARFLSAIRPTLKVLFMSGYTDGALEQKEILAKDLAFIQKPFSWSALSLKLREILDHALVQDEAHEYGEKF
jgi:PAS domain S-box-containing protein